MRRIAILSTLVVIGGLSLTIRAYQAPPQGGGRQGAPAGPTPEGINATAIQRVRDNLYVVTGAFGPRNFPPGGGNTGVFVTDRGVVLIDVKNPGWGQVILDKVRTVTDKPIIMIINTHTHRDHTGGNEFFGAGTMVESVVQENTKVNMEKMDVFQGEKKKFLPTKTFKDTMSLFSGKDRIDLYYFGRGHTNGDAFVVFPALRAAHAGDQFALKEVQLATANDGGSVVEHPQSLAKALAKLRDVDTFITGHSTVMPRKELEEFQQFMKEFVDYADRELKAGKTAEQAAAEWSLPKKYEGHGYQIEPNRVKADMELAFKELQK